MRITARSARKMRESVEVEAKAFREESARLREELALLSTEISGALNEIQEFGQTMKDASK